MLKNKFLKSAVSLLLVIWVVLGMSNAASAASSPINALNSPHSYGTLSTTINWTVTTFSTSANGYLVDNYSDGHGPYMHMFVWFGSSSGSGHLQASSCAIHNTAGTAASVSTSKCAWGGEQIDHVDVWVCNGGDVNGTGAVEGGCAGRTYYNQALYSGKGSSSLGTSYSPS